MPKPQEGESQSDFVSRCISVRQHEHPDEDTKQSSAVCYSVWSDNKKKESKLEKIEEIKETPLLMTDHGVVETQPETLVPGIYPEFEDVELPENLKKKPWERDWDR
jgi:hypothetical protein